MPHTSTAGSADRAVPQPQRDHRSRRLRALRRKLEQHRAFRREQLAQFDAAVETSAYASSAAVVGVSTENPALREVAISVAAGARQALANIEEALDSMAEGRYGLCRACQAEIPLTLLEAIPETLLCPDCLRSFEQGRAPAMRRCPSGRSRRSGHRKRWPHRRHHGL